MTTALFNIELLHFKSLQELPDAWNTEDYKALLNLLDYGDTSGLSPTDAKEMCYMSLADNEPEDAAMIVLNYVFGDELNDGQKENLVHEMKTEKMWEEYPDISFHEKFFNAHQLLFSAYNGKFPRTEAVQFSFKLVEKQASSFKLLDSDVEMGLIRILAQGMQEHTLIKRLYDEQLESGDFEEAKDIIWQYKKSNTDSNSVEITIISSMYWFKDLKFVETFDASVEIIEADH